MDQAQYAYKLLSDSFTVLREIVSSQRYTTDSFTASLLDWVAQVLGSDVLLLSWPDSKGLMHIQERKVLYTAALEQCATVECFDELGKWLDNTEDHFWARDDLSAIPGLENSPLKSIMAAKVLTTQQGFESKQLLVACNRKEIALEDKRYLGYDRLFLGIAQWMLLIYISDRYKQNTERYQDSRVRYKDAKSMGALDLVGETAHGLLRLYIQYCARPPADLVYECLDTHIALFSANHQESGLRTLLETCEKHWREEIQSNQDWIPVRAALARGYFAMGIQNDQDWIKGDQFLKMEPKEA